MQKISKLIAVVALLILAYGIFATNKWVSVSTDKNQLEENYEALNAELVITKNDLGHEVATREIVQVTNKEQLLALQSQDSLFKLLQNEVKRLDKKLDGVGSAVAAISTSTNVSGQTSTVVVRDTINNREVYYSNIDQFGNWITGFHLLGEDTSYIDLNVRNDFTLSLSYEREKGLRNIFKSKKPVATLTNHNPYTNTRDMRVASITNNRKTPWAIGLGVTYGVTPDLQMQAVVGINFSKTLIEF